MAATVVLSEEKRAKSKEQRIKMPQAFYYFILNGVQRTKYKPNENPTYELKALKKKAL